MHEVNIYIHYFYVPNRILWSVSTDQTGAYASTNDMSNNPWERFITGFNKHPLPSDGIEDNGDQSHMIPPSVPLIGVRQGGSLDLNTFDTKEGGLLDHLYGLPRLFGAEDADSLLNVDAFIDALPMRAYGMIYNEWYRDQDLQEPIAIHLSNGPVLEQFPGLPEARKIVMDQTGPTAIAQMRRLLNRNWEKDYFTSARPWPQKGPEVTIGGLGRVPVLSTTGGNIADQIRYSSNGTVMTAPGGLYNNNAGQLVHGNVSGPPVYLNPSDRLYADLTQATGITINDLRFAVQVQKFFERCSRDGTRYVEFLLSHFGVRASDARLDRPEFLGGGKSPVVFSEVLQTSASPTSTSDQDQTPQGNMAGHAISVQRGHSFHKTTEEHGWIIGILSIMPRTSYMQGVARRFTRESHFDWYFPEFAHLGEQAVLTREIFGQNDAADNRSVFGYQGRWDEYRRRESSVHGDFRTSPLDSWHLSRYFSQTPALNGYFVECNIDDGALNRIFAVTQSGIDHFWIQLHHSLTVARAIPKRSIPGLMDHL
jgi:hypothetical protein